MRRWKSLFAGAKYLIAGAFIAGAFATTAGGVKADGMAAPRVATVQEAPTTWSGVYFGIHSGWAWSNYDNTYTAPGVAGQAWSTNSDDPLVGGQIGIQHQFGQVILGLEGTLSTTYQFRENAVQCPNPLTICSGRFNDVLTIGPRIGWAMGKYMPYITGGYANGSFDHRVALTTTGVGTRQSHDRENGWYIGAGVDMALAAGWTMGLEYRHYDFGNFTSDRFIPGGTAALLDTGSVDTNVDTITMRVSWKFDRPERAAAVPLK